MRIRTSKQQFLSPDAKTGPKDKILGFVASYAFSSESSFANQAIGTCFVYRSVALGE